MYCEKILKWGQVQIDVEKCTGANWFLSQLKQYVKYSKRKFKDDFTFQ